MLTGQDIEIGTNDGIDVANSGNTGKKNPNRLLSWREDRDSFCPNEQAEMAICVIIELAVLEQTGAEVYEIFV